MPERGLDHEELALLLGLFTVNPAPGGGAASAAAGGEVTQTTGGQVQGAPPPECFELWRVHHLLWTGGFRATFGPAAPLGKEKKN